MNTIPQRPIVKGIQCRWKHLRGKDDAAVYRATCGAMLGKGECRGHLGDLHRVNGDYLSRRPHRAQPLRDGRPNWPKTYDEERIRQNPGVVVFPRSHPAWIMSASPLVRKPNDAVYRGFFDSGYRIIFGGKRALNGERIGRRLPKYAGEIIADRSPQGQVLLLPSRIWCPMCGTLNELEWPEPLRGCNA